MSATLEEENKVLEYVKSKPELQNNPAALLDAIDNFAIMNIGPAKGAYLISTIEKAKPEVIVEFGTHTGYSSILMAYTLEKIGSPSSKIYTFEANPKLFELSKQIIAISGLGHRIVQTLGKVCDQIETVCTDNKVTKFDLLFLDHWKDVYLPDLRLVETLGYITTGTTLFADNVIRPGAPDYVEYVKSSPSSKKEHNAKVTNINGDKYPGKWQLMYVSNTVESVNGWGERDGVEITNCVGLMA